MRLKVLFAMPVLAMSVVLTPVGAYAQTANQDAKARQAAAEKEKIESRHRLPVSGPNQGMLPSTQTPDPSPDKTTSSADKSVSSDKAVSSDGMPVEAAPSGGFNGRTVFGY